MDLRRKALLLALCSELREAGSWCGETHVQKSAYFLQALMGVDMGFDFILYKHGPFSFELRDAVIDMYADGFLKMESRHPYGPSFQPGRLSSQLKPYLPGESLTSIAFVAAKLGDRDVVELERLGTALMVTLDEGGSAPARARIICKLKPHIAKADAIRAVKQVDAIIHEARRADVA